MNNNDFTFMWWRDGFNKGSQRMYFQTGTYGMAYDNTNGSLCKFGALDAAAADSAYNSDNALIDALPDIKSSVSVLCDGEHVCTGLEQIDLWGAHSRIIEMGTSRCSMDAMYYTFKDCAVKGRMEINALPKFASVTLSAHSYEDIDRFTMSLSLAVPFELISATEDTFCFDKMTVVLHGCTAVWNNGVLTATGIPSRLEKDHFNNVLCVDLLPPSTKKDYAAALKLVKLSAKEMKSGADIAYTQAENGEITLSTNGITPYGYDPSFNGILNFNDAAHREHFERVLLRFENPTDTDLLVPVCFYKDNSFPTSGVCPILRKPNGEPCGIQIQLSKNWHRMHNNAALSDDVFYAALNDPRRHLEGPWLHGWCNIPLKAGEKLELEYNCLFASWGTLWSASHSQLCLAGWGGAYQLWESSAIGSFGEAFCYDAETSHGRAFIDDIRPLTVYTKNDVNSKKYQWTGCNGGGNFILCDDGNGTVPLKDVRSYFRKQGPNLCQVIHTARTADDAISCSFTAFLPRTDDCSRAFHRFEYTFLKDVDYPRLVLYQFGADHYNDNDYPRLCIGNDDGPVSFFLSGNDFEGEFNAPISNVPGYIDGKQTPINIDGNGLFLACLGARMTNTNHCKFGPVANRALVLRSFNGIINGEEILKPCVSLYRTMDFDVPCIALELCLPTNKIKAGSTVSGTVEYLNLPIKKHYYYGTSSVMRSFPDDEFDTHRLALRYSKQGRITATADVGEVLSCHPVEIKCADDTAIVHLKGGLSYAPVTFTGLSSPYGFTLTVKDKNGEYVLDQSANGSDFKQCFLAPDGWELTFNVELFGDDCTLVLKKD